MSLSLAQRLYAARHDVTRVMDMLRTRVKVEELAILAAVQGAIDAVAVEVRDAAPADAATAEERAAARERAASVLAEALIEEGDLPFWRRSPLRYVARAAAPSVARRLLERLEELPAETRRALFG